MMNRIFDISKHLARPVLLSKSLIIISLVHFRSAIKYIGLLRDCLLKDDKHSGGSIVWLCMPIYLIDIIMCM